MRECGTVVELDHPNTIKFYDFGQTDKGELYIAMEFVDGQPLSELVEKEGAMSFDRVEKIMKQVCGSLHEAHEKGIVHRDLKPENVILCDRAGEKDFVKVLDFGIAKRNDAVEEAKEQKLTQAGMVLGTPPYMSPEQFTGKALDRRSDIYALGVMTYEMLTGQLPFKANTPWEWATQHMTAQPSPFEGTGPMAAQIPAGMKQACLRSLKKEANERQGTAKEFFAELSGGGAPKSINAGAAGTPATEAFSADQFAAVGGGGPAPAGKTQIGEPFVPPVGGPGGGASPTAVDAVPTGSPHQNVPTGGGQALPVAPARSAPGGGGNKGMLIAIAGVVAALLVVGIVVAFSGDSDDDGETTDLIPATSATEETDDDPDETDTGDGETEPDGSSTAEPETKTQTRTQTRTRTKTKTKTDTNASGTAACDQAISAAMSGNCGGARSALNRCKGYKRSTAVANVNAKCRRGRIKLRPR